MEKKKYEINYRHYIMNRFYTVTVKAKSEEEALEKFHEDKKFLYWNDDSVSIQKRSKHDN